MRDHPGVVSAVAMASVLLGGCATGDDASLAFPASPGGLDGAGIVADLCSARTASARDRAVAADAFGRAHGPLHDLAAALAERERGLATRFLEAKHQVESALQINAAADELRTRLDELIDETRRGLDAIGLSASPCPTDG